MSEELMNETADRQLTEPASSREVPGNIRDLRRYAVVERIRHLATQEDGLFRIHTTHAGLYARARRLFGTWAAAVRAANVDYDTAVYLARQRASSSRRRRRDRPVAPCAGNVS